MTLNSYKAAAALSLILASTLVGCNSSNNNSNSADGNSDNTPVAASCAVAAAQALQICTDVINTAQSACYADGDAACDDGNADFIEAHATLQTTLESSCSDGEFMGLSVDATVGRLQNACQSQSDAIAWRTFGGPQGAVWPACRPPTTPCPGFLTTH
jgi:hypothetical protein